MTTSENNFLKLVEKKRHEISSLNEQMERTKKIAHENGVTYNSDGIQSEIEKITQQLNSLYQKAPSFGIAL